MKIQSILTAIASLVLGSATLSAAVPSGYYSTCENKCGAALLTALNQKISSHTTISYNALLDLYKTSDVKSNGKIWDMYSTKEWNTGETCGNYSYVGDCYNREHSMPKSWFDDASPMVSDAFHIYPTDGKVNGQRSNYPYGECSGGTTLPSHNGYKALGKLGRSTFAGYSGTVFEPDDEYKGDFARSYFYMVACYNEKISSWSSDMLAGNKYPGLSSWAVNLLLKWHRQDPVSEKERSRNEVVYGRQRNRNPFIDYPDLAEHIWGDEKNIAWSSTGSATPVISLPVNGSSINLGYTAVNHPVSTSVTVMGANITADVSASISGSGYTISASSLSASAVNSPAGASLIVTANPQSAGISTATLTLRSGSATSTVTFTIEAMTGIPLSDPTEITSESFSFTWVDIDGGTADYTIVVSHNGTPVAGYPVTVKSSVASHTATSLMPETSYTYQVRSASLASQVKTVTTGALVPWIGFLHAGELYFTTEPGVASKAEEIDVETENIDGNITLTVTAPFQLSTDKTSWDTSLVLSPDEDRFYLRLYSIESGEFSSTLRAQAGDYLNDDVTIAGIVSSTPDFEETFEVDETLSGYTSQTIAGTAANWKFENIYFNSNTSEAHGGSHSLRFAKSGTASSALMASDKNHGAGEISFYARAWSATEPATLKLQYSTDGGITWSDHQTFTISDATYREYTATLNAGGNIRIGFVRTEGGRACLDDISISNYVASSIEGVESANAWDAYAAGGQVIVEINDGTPRQVAVYGTDGITYFLQTVDSAATVALQPGLYIVVVDDYARRVLVK